MPEHPDSFKLSDGVQHLWDIHQEKVSWMNILSEGYSAMLARRPDGTEVLQLLKSMNDKLRPAAEAAIAAYKPYYATFNKK